MQAAGKPAGRYFFEAIFSQQVEFALFLHNLYVSPVTDHHRTHEHYLGNPDDNVFKRTCTGYLEESLLKPSWSATSNYRKTFSANWCEACHYKLIVTWSFKYTRQICNYSWLQTLILNIHKFKNTALLAFKQHLPFKPLRSKLYIGSLITEEEEWFSASIILSRAGRL